MEKKILIAEDELIVAYNLEQTLINGGYTVCHISKSGRDMIESALKYKPDLMIVDIYLDDDIDGIDAVSEIHKNSYIPVIYTTASTDSLTLKKAKKTTMIDYLNKPYEGSTILNSIQSLL